MKNFIRQSEGKTIEGPPGIFRTTLSYNEQTMMCHFIMKKGAEIPLHNHKAVQNGYIAKGRVKFKRGRNGSSFTVDAGCSYVFGSDEYHSAEVLEDTEALECFSPMRPEYVP